MLVVDTTMLQTAIVHVQHLLQHAAGAARVQLVTLLNRDAAMTLIEWLVRVQGVDHLPLWALSQRT